MKKLILSLVILIGVSASSFSQIHPHAIGLRGGNGNFGPGGELSYQHGLGDNNRLEIDLGWRGNYNNGNNYRHSTLTGVYHWVFELSEGFNWYAGIGAQLGSYKDKWNSNDDGLTLSLGGQLGLEYDLNQHELPLLLSLDIRPMWGFLGATSGAGYGYALGIRYTFD